MNYFFREKKRCIDPSLRGVSTRCLYWTRYLYWQIFHDVEDVVAKDVEAKDVEDMILLLHWIWMGCVSSSGPGWVLWLVSWLLSLGGSWLLSLSPLFFVEVNLKSTC